MSAKLERKISLYSLTMIAAGSCIGSGIFRSPSETAAYLPYDSWVLIAWVVGGIIMLAGALSIAELGAMFPEAGGVYVYLRRIYGDAAAFLYGWASLTVIVSGALAAIALVFAGYVDSFFHFSENSRIALSLAVVIALSVLNVFGVKTGNAFATVITTAKLLGIFAVIVIGFWLGNEPLDFHTGYSNFKSKVHEQMPFVSAFGLASIGVYFSYGGFHHASYLAGEVKNVKQTLPRAMIFGTLIVLAVYVLINMAYLKLLPVEQVAASNKVASDAVSTVLKYGSEVIALLIAVSTLGTIGIYSMSAPRIYYALASDGLFFRKIAEVHPRYHTPANAIIIQCIIACIILLFWQTFEEVINYIVFVDYLFMVLAVAGVIYLRIKSPAAERPYKTWGYPVTPILFAGFTTYVLVVTLIEKPITGWTSIAFLLLGYLAFILFRKKTTHTTHL